MAVALLCGVGGIGVSPWMALLLILEAAALLLLLYLRTRLAWALPALRRSRITSGLVEALTIRSGHRDCLFTPRTELVLMAAAFIILAVISVPIAKAAYGSGSLLLYGVLLGGAVVLAVKRLSDPERPPRAYWLSFALLLRRGDVAQH